MDARTSPPDDDEGSLFYSSPMRGFKARNIVLNVLFLKFEILAGRCDRSFGAQEEEKI
ncbi:hypothetical protein [[Eubacterium] cellulosolvens]